MNGFTLSLISLFYPLCWLALALTTLFSSSLLKRSSEWQSTARSVVSRLKLEFSNCWCPSELYLQSFRY